jgi:hypothetical protein
LKISLKPTVGVKLDPLGAEASVSAAFWVRGDAAFQYPAFSSLSSSYESPLTTRPALFHLGSCTAPHLLRYAVTAGVSDIIASASIDFNLDTVLGMGTRSGWSVQKFYSLPLPDVEPYSLVSGCFFQVNNDALTATFTISMVSHLDSSGARRSTTEQSDRTTRDG